MSQHYGCHDHAFRSASVEGQVGWNADGTRRMFIFKPPESANDCRYADRFTDPRCADCKWQQPRQGAPGEPNTTPFLI